MLKKAFSKKIEINKFLITFKNREVSFLYDRYEVRLIHYNQI